MDQKMYLNASYGVCIGGMFFKEGDSVYIEGRGFRSNSKLSLNGKIVSFSSGVLSVLRSDSCRIAFDLYKITRIEHIKEK